MITSFILDDHGSSINSRARIVLFIISASVLTVDPARRSSIPDQGRVRAPTDWHEQKVYPNGLGGT